MVPSERVVGDGVSSASGLSCERNVRVAQRSNSLLRGFPKGPLFSEGNCRAIWTAKILLQKHGSAMQAGPWPFPPLTVSFNISVNIYGSTVRSSTFLLSLPRARSQEL